MKIACDNQVSKQICECLSYRGYEIVYRAQNEPDEVWIENALILGANVFISPDLDVPNYLDKNGADYIWIDIEQGLAGTKLSNYLIKKLKKLAAA